MNFSKKNHEHKKNDNNFVSKTIKLTMQSIKYLTLIALFIGFTSCDNDVGHIS